MSLTVEPIESPAGFGCYVHGANLNDLSDADFDKIEEALYTHKLVVITKQKDLQPQKQYELNRRFDRTASGLHGHGGKDEVLKKTFKGRQNITLGFPSVPGVDMVRLVGQGTFPAGHYGTTEPLTLAASSHRSFHLNPLDEETMEKDHCTRFQRFHIDAQLFPKENHTARVTSLWAHTLPVGPPLTVRLDDGSSQVITGAKPGRTAFMDSSSIFREMSPEDQQMVLHSEVEYAPNPYEWIINCKGQNSGFSLMSQGKEMDITDLPDGEDGLDKVQRLPMCWINPLNKEPAFQVHAIVARKLHIRRSADEPFEVIEDLEEVRSTLNRLQRPHLRQDKILFSPQEEGDLVVWYNRGLRHSAVEYPPSYGPRMMHQVHLQGSDSVADMEKPGFVLRAQEAAEKENLAPAA